MATISRLLAKRRYRRMTRNLVKLTRRARCVFF